MLTTFLHLYWAMATTRIGMPSNGGPSKPRATHGKNIRMRMCRQVRHLSMDTYEQSTTCNNTVTSNQKKKKKEDSSSTGRHIKRQARQNKYHALIVFRNPPNRQRLTCKKSKRRGKSEMNRHPLFLPPFSPVLRTRSRGGPGTKPTGC